MPMYAYRCSVCGHTEEHFFTMDDPAREPWDGGEMFHTHKRDDMEPWAGTAGTMRRVFSFSTPADPFGDGYFDHGVGAFVRNKTELDDINKAKSAAHSERTGVETNFVAHRIEDAAPRLRPDD